MVTTPSVHAAQVSRLDVNNVCPVLASGNAQAIETDGTVMGNSRQPLPATSYDWSTAVAATSSPAPEWVMSSNMFSVLSLLCRLNDCGDEGSDSQ